MAMPRTASSETDALDAINPETNPGLDAGPWRRIIAARKAVGVAEDELRAAVEAARDAGYSWSTIGSALESSRQAAHQRFNRQLGR